MAGESSETNEKHSIEDLLRLQETAFSAHKDQMKEVLEDLAKMMKEFRETKELQEDMVREYDKLSQRVSTQIRALIEVTSRQERVS